jgi:hypothetical protein
LRDDAALIVAALDRTYRKKLDLLQKLLLNESDLIHYATTENIERVNDILGEDAGILEQIDLVDFNISRDERGLAALMGVQPGGLHGALEGDAAASEFLVVRKRVRENIKELFRRREELSGMLGSSARTMGKNIEELSLIGKLRVTEPGEEEAPGR